jgi:hypothetical protein
LSLTHPIRVFTVHGEVRNGYKFNLWDSGQGISVGGLFLVLGKLNVKLITLTLHLRHLRI